MNNSSNLFFPSGGKSENQDPEGGMFTSHIYPLPERWREAFEAITEGYWEYDAISNEIYYSKRLKNILGYEHQESIHSLKENVLNVHPSDLPNTNEVFAKYLSGETPSYECTHRLKCKNGSYIWILSRGHVISKDANDKPLLIVGSIQELTDKKKIENELIESENRFKALANNIPAILWQTNKKGETEFINDEYWKFIGKEKDSDFLGVPSHWKNAIHPKEKDEMILMQAKAFSEHKPYSLKYRLMHHSGAYRWIVNNGVPRFLADGTFIGMLGYAVDIDNQVKAELELKESEERFRKMVDGSPNMEWMTNERNECIYVNSTFLKFTGNNFEHEMGLGFLKNIHPDDFSMYFGKDLFLLSLKVWTDVVLRLKNKSGEYKWVKFVANPRLSADDTFLGHMGICIDIDDQINSISEAKSVRTMLLNASSNAKMAFYERNIATNKMVFSGAIQEMLELEPFEKPSYELFFGLMKEEYKEMVAKAIAKLRKTGKEFNVVFEIITRKGNRRILRALGGSERIKNVKIKNYAIFFDITEDYLKSEHLTKIKENLSAVFENSSDSFVLIDKDQKVEFFNKSAYFGMIDLFNVHMKLNKPIINFVPDEDKVEFGMILTKVFNGELASVERKYKSKYGEKWFKFRFFPIKTGEKVTKVSFVATDFTELKLKELENERLISELRLHNQELLQFSYIVSHNLRGPVANIIGLADMLNASKSLQKQQEISKMLGVASNNLDRVIYDLNEILSLKRNAEDFGKVDLGEIFEAAKQLCQRPIQDHNPIIKANFKALAQIYSVKGYVLSFFYNFISNSLKYRNKEIRTTIEITAYEEANKFVLVFQDNGQGIDLEKYGDRIFGLYQRFHNNLNIDGKGFGLHLVKSQVIALGGEIEVESKINAGTKFTIKLPNIKKG